MGMGNSKERTFFVSQATKIHYSPLRRDQHKTHKEKQQTMIIGNQQNPAFSHLWNKILWDYAWNLALDGSSETLVACYYFVNGHKLCHYKMKGISCLSTCRQDK